MSGNMAFVSIHYDRILSSLKSIVDGFSRNIAGVFSKCETCRINKDSKGEYEILIAIIRLELNNYFGQETRSIRL